MDNSTRLDGSSLISQAPEKVWKIEKKRKTDDHPPRRNGKRLRSDRDDVADREIPVKSYNTQKRSESDSGEDISYGNAGQKKRANPMVDVII